MDNEKKREPQQKRSIEKKQKILEAGCKLFCKNGYLKTTTADIAREAGVSTGIIYSYYSNKKDILRGCLNHIYIVNCGPIYTSVRNLRSVDNLLDNFGFLIDETIKFHHEYKGVHEEFIALSYLDKDVAEAMNECNMNMVNDVVEVVRSLGYDSENIVEKVHVVLELFESYTHEVAYHKCDGIDYDVLKKYYISLIKTVLSL